MAGSWSLDSAEELNERNPRRFFIPPTEQRRRLKVGDRVKLVFSVNPRRPVAIGSERMWVEIRATHSGGYVGCLLDTPLVISELRQGDAVEFGPEHVASIEMDEDVVGFDPVAEAEVDPEILEENREPILMYKDGPGSDTRGRWHVLLSRPQEAATEPSRKTYMSLGYLVDLFPKTATAFRDGTPGWWQLRTDGSGYEHV
jgi:hypothetical protein